MHFIDEGKAAAGPKRRAHRITAILAVHAEVPAGPAGGFAVALGLGEQRFDLNFDAEALRHWSDGRLASDGWAAVDGNDGLTLEHGIGVEGGLAQAKLA